MKTFTWIHRLVIVALCGMAILNVSSLIRTPQPLANPLPIIIGAIGGWTLIIWGISIRPKPVGLWLGLFLVGSVLLQMHLRQQAIHHAAMLHMPPEPAAAFWRFLTSEILTGVTALLCLLLRICPSPHSPKGVESLSQTK